MKYDHRVEPQAAYVPPFAVAFADPDGKAVIVDSQAPLPVFAATPPSATSTPLTGTTAAAATVGPFAPDLGRPIWVTLSGHWSGSAALLRSTDGGDTRLPLTAGGAPWGSFTGNVNEAVAQESDAAAQYWLQLAPSAGTVTYRVSQ